MKINKRFKLNDHSSQAIRYVTVAFSVIGLILIAISLFSFLGAKRVEQEYDTLIADSINKLNLVSDLHTNEETIFQAITAHLGTTDADTKLRLESAIQQANEKNKRDIAQLSQLLTDEHKKALLKDYIRHRELHHAELVLLLKLSRQNKTEAAYAYSNKYLMPFFKVHQEFLDNLSEQIKGTAMSHGNHALYSVRSSINKFNLLLLIALMGTILSGLLIRKFIKQLKRDNTILNTEIRERQQLEKALSQSQNQYKLLFNSNPVPMWVYDRHNASILDVNEAATQEYGYTKSEFISKTILDLLPQEDHQAYLDSIQKVGPKSTTFKKVLHKRKDGTRFYVNIESLSLPVQDSVLPQLVVAANVDEQVHAIAQLEKNEKVLREISSSIPGAVYQFQLDKSRKLKFNFASDGIQRVFGLLPQELYENPQVLEEYLHPDDYSTFLKSIMDSYQDLQPWEHEFRIWQQQLNKYIWIKGQSLPSAKEDGVVIWNGTIIDINTQKEAQNKLISSEANLRALLDSSPQAIYLLDSNLKIISFNAEAHREVNAYLLKEITVNQSILDYIADSHVVDTIKSHASAMLGETVVFERRQGTMWFEVTFRPVKTPDEHVIAVALNIENITEQKQTLDTIRRSEMQLERAQELANLGNWEYDIPNSLLTWSDNIYKIYGVSKKYFSPSVPAVNTLIHPEDVKNAAQAFEKSIAEKQMLRLEHRIIRPDGNVRNVIEIGEIIQDEEGLAIKVSGSIQDITDRKNAEREALAARKLLQSTIENIPEIIFSADASLSLTYVSPQSYEILGYMAQELEGNTELWTRGIHKEDMPLLESQVIPKLRMGLRQQQEVRVVTREGEIKWLLLRLSPVLDKQGIMVRLDGSAADMTFYKKAETKRNELTEQLMLQNQNLQQFAYIVSHNLRAPIANILGLTSIYDRVNPGAAFNQQVVNNLFKSTQLLDSTIHDLNDLLTVRSEINCVREDVSFESVFSHIRESLTDEINKAGARVDIDFNHAPNLTTIKSYLQSIMLNLVSNALKYRSAGRNLQLQVKTFKVPDYICLAICDNGMGIDLEKEKGKIFGLYKRFHHSIEGKGLGLHLVKTQAELLGGKVDVESTPDVGTTFSVYFKV